MGVDRAALEGSLRRLDQLAVADLDTATLMEEVVQAAGRMLPVSGIGLMVVDASHALRYVAASDESGRFLEDAQEQTGEGPCVAAFVLDGPVSTPNLAADDRWPRLGPLVEPSGVRAVLGVPVRLGGGPVGTLDAYLNHPAEWDTEQVTALTGYATVVENLLAASVALHRGSEMARQLQYALDYRVSIERAIGYLMGREQIDPVTAFNRLRSRARSTRRRIGEVALEALGGGPLP